MLFLVASAIVLLAHLSVLFSSTADSRRCSSTEWAAVASQADTIVNVMQLVLLAILAYLFVRALNALIFGLAFRLRSGFDAPTLVRNIFSIVAFTALFLLDLHVHVSGR